MHIYAQLCGFSLFLNIVMSVPEINISSVQDIVSDILHYVCSSGQSSVYDILLNFENLSVIVTSRKKILSVTYEIVPDSDR